MFNGCSGLTSLDLSSFRTKNCRYFDDMFHGCSHLEALNIAVIDMGNAEYYGAMFTDCAKLKTLAIPVDIANAGSIFDGCTSMEDVYCYKYAPFTWPGFRTAFAPNKATRFHVLASAYEAWIERYGPKRLSR